MLQPASYYLFCFHTCTYYSSSLIYISFIRARIAHIFFVRLYFGYCHMNVICYLSSIFFSFRQSLSYMYRPIRARNARYVCNVLVLFAFFTYALSNFSFL